MFYIIDGYVYFYNKYQNKSYAAEVNGDKIVVFGNNPMEKHKDEDIKSYYNRDQILRFAHRLKKHKAAKKNVSK